jgi:putative SOS response-associated peptidase YedK
MSRRLVVAGKDEVDEEFEITRRWWQFSARFNVRKSQNVPAVRMHEGESEGVVLRWGIPPRKEESGVTIPGAALVSCEDLGSGARHAAWLARQRCIVPLAGFYVWQLSLTGVRQPFYVRLVNRPVFGVAAIWERTVSEDDEDDVIEACALLTVPSNPLLTGIDSSEGQMLAILERRDYSAWLTSADSVAQALLKPYPHERMLAHAVPPYVNYPEYDGPPLIHAIRQ